MLGKIVLSLKRMDLFENELIKFHFSIFVCVFLCLFCFSRKLRGFLREFLFGESFEVGIDAFFWDFL